MTDKVQDLQQLLTISRIMLEKAREGAWNEVSSLETQRSESIRQFFLVPVQQVYADAVAAAIQAIMTIDRDIMALGVLKKVDLAQTLQTLEQGKRAIKAYVS